MNENTRNYHAHGGGEWVIGGKLTFLPGATVEGAEGLFDLLPAELLDAPVIRYIPDSEATTVAQLRDNFNSLLAALREADLMTPEPTETTEPGEAREQPDEDLEP
jgi:hypothetical protein